MVKLTIAIYPGSFDPVTNGHIDVLYRASMLFEYVTIAVLVNPSKNSFLPIDDRIKLIKESVKEIKNVEVDYFDGLTVDYARKKGAKVLIRGLRAYRILNMRCKWHKLIKPLLPTWKPYFLFLVWNITLFHRAL